MHSEFEKRRESRSKIPFEPSSHKSDSRLEAKDQFDDEFIRDQLEEPGEAVLTPREEDDLAYEHHKNNFGSFINYLGEDVSREGLVKTPERYMKSMKFLTSGYNTDIDSIVNGALFDVDYQDMVIVRDIEFFSLCEHHILPFYGKVHVGYIPDKKIIGLSKIPRIVDAMSRRLQVQERLTSDISKTLCDILSPLGVGVVVEGYHLCMMMRGVQKQNSYTLTSNMQGTFRKLKTREEFLHLIRKPSPM